MSKKAKKRNSIRVPGVVYVTTSDLKNKTGEIIEKALTSDKPVIIEKHGREILKLAKIEERSDEEIRKLVKKRERALKKIAGSIPDLMSLDEIRSHFGQGPREN